MSVYFVTYKALILKLTSPKKNATSCQSNCTRMKEIDREVKGLLEEVVTEREKAMKEGVDEEDLLELLLKSNMKAIQEFGHKKGISEEDVTQ